MPRPLEAPPARDRLGSRGGIGVTLPAALAMPRPFEAPPARGGVGVAGAEVVGVGFRGGGEGSGAREGEEKSTGDGEDLHFGCLFYRMLLVVLGSLSMEVERTDLGLGDGGFTAMNECV